MAMIPSIADVQEAKPVPNGPYDLTITEATDGKSQAGKPQIRVSLGIEGHTDAPNVTHFISLPAEGDDSGKVNFKLLLLKRFCTLFGIQIPKDGINSEQLALQMPGAKARVELTLSEPTETGDVYNRLNVPKIKGESSAPRGAPKPPKS